MPKSTKDRDQVRGDDILRRMLKSPPKPKRSDEKPKSHESKKKPKD